VRLVRAPGAWGPRPLRPRRHWLWLVVAVGSGQWQARPFPARARRRGGRQLARHPSDHRGRRMAGLQAACSTGAGMGELPGLGACLGFPRRDRPRVACSTSPRTDPARARLYPGLRLIPACTAPVDKEDVWHIRAGREGLRCRCQALRCGPV
jgi:hypothetical protein